MLFTRKDAKNTEDRVDLGSIEVRNDQSASGHETFRPSVVSAMVVSAESFRPGSFRPNFLGGLIRPY